MKKTQASSSLYTSCWERNRIRQRWIVWPWNATPDQSSPPATLQTVVLWCSQYQGIHSYQVKVIFKLLLQVIVSSLWRERNARIFRNVSLTPLAFFKLVDRSLRDRLLSITRDPSQALSLLQFYFWFLVLIANRWCMILLLSLFFLFSLSL